MLINEQLANSLCTSLGQPQVVLSIADGVSVAFHHGTSVRVIL
jgi:hypothetical protein